MNKDGRVVLMAVLVVEVVFIMTQSIISPLPPQATPCYWCPRWWSGTPPGQMMVYNGGVDDVNSAHIWVSLVSIWSDGVQ